mmetsp:Transcript_39129/g.93703  ORF Transcript_39129/g.93703 Transcript_39129/m.93703 type:complete len:156 (-) Transcript_39129:892-1359(-)
MAKKKAHRSDRSRSERRSDAKKAKKSAPAPVSFAAVPKASTSSSTKVKAAWAARDSIASKLHPRSLRGRNARDRVHDAMLSSRLEEIRTMLDNGQVPGGGKDFVFFDGSHEKSPTTFPDHARGKNVVVLSVHDMMECGGVEGCIYRQGQYTHHVM